MRIKLTHLIIASLISLIFAFSPASRIFFNDNCWIAFGSTNYISYWDWCGQYQLGSCSTPPPPVINDYYVDDDNTSGPWNGTKVSPYKKIEDAINAASSGNTIYVAGGTYQENLYINNKDLTLIGGWDSSFTQRNISTHPYSSAYETIIDGGGIKRVIRIANGLNNNNSIIDGFTIKNGGNVEEGGGISITDAGEPTITNNLITQNAADNNNNEYPDGEGGGIYVNHASPIITNNTIENNYAIEDGGGIMLYTANPDTLIVNNVIRNNSAEAGGGIGYNGVVVNNTTLSVVINNIITDNSAVEGGGIFIYGSVDKLSTSIFSNNTIANNTASSGDGGGIYVSFDAYPTITNTILWDNGDDLYVTPGESVFVSYSDIDDVNYNGPNYNISADPLFVNPSTGDYHLLLGSPAIDTGKDTSGLTYGSVVDDIIGTLRPQDGDGNGFTTGDMSDYDIGAYEMPAMPAFVENNPEQVSEMGDTLNERLNRKVAVKPAQTRTSNVIPKKSLNRGKSISRYKR